MNTKLTIRIILAVVIVGLVGLVAWRGLHGSPISTPTPTPTDTATTMQSPSVSASPLPITYGTVPSDWQVYSSASLGIKISYPKDWRSQVCGEGCIAFGPATATEPAIGISMTQTTMADTLHQLAPYLVSQQTITVGSISWTKVVLQLPQSNAIFVSHLVERKGILTEIGLAVQDPADAAIYGQMVRSFSFTK